MQHTLVAVFDNRSDAQLALDDLIASGFAREEVRLSESDAAGQAAQASAAAERRDDSFGAGLKNFFSDLFGTDRSEHARIYAEAVSRGHFVLTLTAGSEPEVERAAGIVERYGPLDIDEQAQQWSSGIGADAARASNAVRQQSAGMSQQFAQGSAQGDLQGDSTQGSQQRAETTAIPVIQEELKVGKREVERGGVRIYNRIVETPVDESIGLREEHVQVQRRPVDKPVDPADATAFRERTIEVRETSEEAVIEKTARVVEEVVVGKQVTQRKEQIHDTVRHTEVEVEQLAPDDDAYFRGHWTSTFASQGGDYADYAPAYRYGSTMARSDLYRGRPWNDVEHNLRTDWEARHPGSAWESFKAAVRHGWERMTS